MYRSKQCCEPPVIGCRTRRAVTSHTGTGDLAACVARQCGILHFYSPIPLPAFELHQRSRLNPGSALCISNAGVCGPDRPSGNCCPHQRCCGTVRRPACRGRSGAARAPRRRCGGAAPAGACCHAVTCMALNLPQRRRVCHPATAPRPARAPSRSRASCSAPPSACSLRRPRSCLWPRSRWARPRASSWGATRCLRLRDFLAAGVLAAVRASAGAAS